MDGSQRNNIGARVALGLAVLGTAAVLRAPALWAKSWAIDPIISWQVARKPLLTAHSFAPQAAPYDSIVAFCLHDKGPGPLAYALDGLCAPLSKPLGGEGWLAVPSFVAGLALIASVLLLGRRLCGGFAGALAMASCCVAFPLFADLSGMPRGYNWALLALVGQLAILRALLDEHPPARRPVALWVGFLTLAAVAFFIHPLSIAVGAGLGAAVLAARWKSRGAAGAIPAPAFWGGTALLGVATGAWLLAWVAGLNSANPGQATAFTAGELGQRFLDLATEAIGLKAPYFLALAAAVAVLGWPRLHPAERRILLLIGGLALAAELLLAIVFLARFFAAARHFYPAPLLLFWIIGVLTEAACRDSGRGRRAGIVLATVALLVLPAREAHCRLREPYADWATLVRRYAQIHQPSDLVLVGPNSESEVFWTYAEALGLDVAVAPRYLVLPDGSKVDTQTEEGIRAALTAPRPVYYFTGSWGMRRPPSYWELVEKNFEELEPIPGRVEIRAWRRLPPAGK